MSPRRATGLDLAHGERVALGLAAWAASTMAAQVADAGSTARQKSHPADLVTPVDERIERHLRAALLAEFPGHRVVGEEFGAGSGAGAGADLVAGDAPVWLIDPIDGTMNYAHDLGWSSFSLALVQDGRPLLGVVADPWRGEIFSAVRGQGARRRTGTAIGNTPRNTAGRPPGNAVTITASCAQQLAGEVVLTEWLAHRPWAGMERILAGRADRYCTVRIMGSTALSLAQVAAGRAAAVVLGAADPIDAAAGMLIAAEAGARLLPHSSSPACSGPALIAAGPGVCDEVWTLAHHPDCRDFPPPAHPRSG